MKRLISIAKHVDIRWLRLTVFIFTVGVLLGTTSPLLASEPIEVGYRDFQYPPGTGGNSEPTGEKPESKLWWNDGYWWGSLWSTAGNAYHIYRLDLATQTWIDTGTPLDDRSDSRADTLWDGNKLYVASHIFAQNAGAPAPAGERGELFRYSYDPATKTYSLDSGFPVEITGGKSETLVLEKDSVGQLWVTYVEDQKVMVNHSNGDDRQWGTPFVLPVDQAHVSSDDISSIITYNQHVGIMWSNQNSPREMYFAVHPVGAGDQVWTQVRAYGSSGDDHISLKSLEADSQGNVYAVIKTSRNAELIMLLVCERNINRCRTESDWTSYFVYDGEHNPTRPILLIDTSNRELYVFTRNVDTNGDHGIYYKTSSLDNIQFPPGIGIPFIKSATETRINDPTSTKQNLNSTTGLVVLASDSGPDYYFHNYKSLTTGDTTQYTLAVNTLGLGSVALDPPGGVYDEGTTVTLTATADSGWAFGGWGGDLSGADNPATVTMDGNKTVTATFTETGGGGGGEVVHQETQTGGSTNSSNVSTGAPLAAAAGDVYIAAISSRPKLSVQSVSGLDLSWTRVREQCSGRNATGVEIWLGQGTPSGPTVVSATLAGTTKNTVLAVSRYSGVASVGSVVAGNSNGVDGLCSGGTDSNSYAFDLSTTANGSFVYSAAALRNKRHEPGAGYTERAEVMQGSGGDVAGVAVQDHTVAAPATVAVDGTLSGTTDWAVVGLELRPGAGGGDPTPTQYTLAVNVQGSGSVAFDPPGGVYDEGTVVSLAATANPGWTFSGWSGDLSGADNPATVTMDGNKTVTATFAEVAPTQYTLAVNVQGSGSVALDPPGGVYDEGTVVSLAATADPGWTFSGWSGDLSGADNPATVTMDGSKTVTATFAEVAPTQYTLAVNVQGSGSVALDPPGGVYDEGTVVSLAATADPGWTFSGWSGDLSGADNPATVTMDGNKVVTATFTETGGGGDAEVLYRETQTGGSTSSTSVSTDAPLTAADGDVYIAAISSKPYRGVQTVSGLGLTWTRVREQCAGRNQTGVEVWIGQGTPAADGPVSATLTGAPQNAVIAVSRYSGVGSVGNVVAGNTNGQDGSCSGGTDSSSYAFQLSTTSGGSVVYGAAAIRNKRHEPGAGYTEQAEVSQGNGGSMAGLAVQDRLVATAATVLVDGSIRGNTDWAIVGLELRPAVQGVSSLTNVRSFGSSNRVSMSTVRLFGTEGVGQAGSRGINSQPRAMAVFGSKFV